MQGRLVDDGTGEHRLTVRLMSQAQALEPLRPAVFEVPSDPNLIERLLAQVTSPEHESGFRRAWFTQVTKTDRIASLLVNQGPRQSPKDVTWGVYGGLFPKGTGGGGGGKRGRNLQQIELSGLRPGLGTAAHVELGEDVVDVLFDGACGEDKFLRDIPV